MKTDVFYQNVSLLKYNLKNLDWNISTRHARSCSFKKGEKYSDFNLFSLINKSDLNLTFFCNFMNA